MSGSSIRRLWRLYQGGARSPLDPPIRTARSIFDRTWKQSSEHAHAAGTADDHGGREIEEQTMIDDSGDRFQGAVDGAQVRAGRERRVHQHAAVVAQGTLSPPRAGQELLRSEERRVGKECRSRWSPYH